MIIQKGFKFRLYPDANQREFLANQFGAVRFVHNYFLANRKAEYLNNKKQISFYDDCKLLTELKNQEGFDWLYTVNAQSLQASLRNLEVSYRNFFRGTARFPRFHARKNDQSLKIPQGFSTEAGRLYIPKLKSGIKITLHRELPGKQISVNISKTASNKYYASFLCEIEAEAKPPLNNSIGIDLGIKHLVVDSNGQKITSPKYYRELEKKLAYRQRQLAKKKKNSNNRNKERIKLARIHERAANRRKDFTHKLTRRLIDENQVIIAESLSVKNMMSNHNLAKSISDAGWGELLRQLAYKAEWYGRTFLKVNRWFPSSKTCSNCQFVVDDLPLNIREWNCPSCLSHLDRDTNAAINIRNQGLNDLQNVSGDGTASDPKQKLAEALTAHQSESFDDVGSMKQETVSLKPKRFSLR